MSQFVIIFLRLGFWITGGTSAEGDILASTEFVRGQDDNVKVDELPVLPSGINAIKLLQPEPS